jgi:branched-chain amino acid transport system permease protein
MLGQTLISGLAVGCIYSLVAFGFSITFTCNRTLNFGQGQVVMLGAMLAYTFSVTLNMPFIVSLICVTFLVALIGILLEKVAVYPFLKFSTSMGWVLSTLAASIVIENVALLLWGKQPLQVPSIFGSNAIRILGIGMFPQEIIILIAAVLIVAGTEIFYKKTGFGRALRATAENEDAAKIMGVNTRLSVSFSYALSSAIAGVAGFLLAPLTSASPDMGGELGLKAFGVAIIGGLVDFKGVILSGLILGVFENLVAVYISSSQRNILGFSLVIALLLIRPLGILVKNYGQKV